MVSTTGTSPKVSRVFSARFFQQDGTENRLSPTSTPRTAYVLSLSLVSRLPISKIGPGKAPKLDYRLNG